MWKLQSEDSALPKWLTDNLASRCECGSEMENYYNDNGEITSRRCSNENCPFRMAQKIVGMCELLDLKGIGEKTAYKMIQQYKLKSHLDAIKYITDKKISINLYTFLRLLFVKGISTGWASIAEKYSTIEEMLEKYSGKYAGELRVRKDEILRAAGLFEWEAKKEFEYDPIIRGTVMISGNLRGWNNRNSFIAALNYGSKGLIQLGVAESKRKTGIMALIQEADTPNRGKAECALECGIPIMTPADFQSMIMKRLTDKLQERREVYDAERLHRASLSDKR